MTYFEIFRSECYFCLCDLEEHTLFHIVPNHTSEAGLVCFFKFEATSVADLERSRSIICHCLPRLLLLPDRVSTNICIKTLPIKYSSKVNRICCVNRTYFLFSYKNQTIPIGVQIRKSFDVSVMVKYSYHFTGGLIVELQWHVYQNKIAVGFLVITIYSLGKVTSLLSEKFVFSVCVSKSFKSSLFDICRTILSSY